MSVDIRCSRQKVELCRNRSLTTTQCRFPLILLENQVGHKCNQYYSYEVTGGFFSFAIVNSAHYSSQLRARRQQEFTYCFTTRYAPLRGERMLITASCINSYQATSSEAMTTNNYHLIRVLLYTSSLCIENSSRRRESISHTLIACPADPFYSFESSLCIHNSPAFGRSGQT